MPKVRYCFPHGTVIQYLAVWKEATKRCHTNSTLLKQTSGNLKHNHSFIFKPFHPHLLPPRVLEGELNHQKAFPNALLKNNNDKKNISPLLFGSRTRGRGGQSSADQRNSSGPPSAIFFFQWNVALCQFLEFYCQNDENQSPGPRPLKAVSLPLSLLKDNRLLWRLFEREVWLSTFFCLRDFFSLFPMIRYRWFWNTSYIVSFSSLLWPVTGIKSCEKEEEYVLGF